MRRRRLTDAELLATELIVSDAYAQGGLTLEVLPRDVVVLDAIHMHRHARYPSEKVFCCVCGSRLHRNGYRVVCSDHRETLLGNCCARPRLGTTWLKAEAELKELRTRKDYIRELHALAPTALRAVRDLGDWLEFATAIRAKQIELYQAMPQAYELMVRSAKRDGILLATERVRKLRWQNTQGDDKRDDFYWEHIPVRHIIRGRLFLQETNPVGLTDAVEHAISVFSSVAKDTDKHRTKVLKSACAKLSNSVAGLRRLSEMKDAANEFFGPENLAGIERWVTLLGSGHDRSLRERIEARNGALTNLVSGTRVTAPQVLIGDVRVIEALTYRVA